jgi:hypothetical protein
MLEIISVSEAEDGSAQVSTLPNVVSSSIWRDFFGVSILNTLKMNREI